MRPKRARPGEAAETLREHRLRHRGGDGAALRTSGARSPAAELPSWFSTTFTRALTFSAVACQLMILLRFSYDSHFASSIASAFSDTEIGLLTLCRVSFPQDRCIAVTLLRVFTIRREPNIGTSHQESHLLNSFPRPHISFLSSSIHFSPRFISLYYIKKTILQIYKCTLVIYTKVHILLYFK